MELIHKIESLLLVTPGELSVSQLTRILHAEKNDVEEALTALVVRFGGESGIVLLRSGDNVRLATNPQCAAMLAEYLHTEITGELTRPQLEALTIIAYRGPVTQAEIEMIRGMQCTLILRNLLIRGLITEEPGTLETRYTLSLETIRLLGITSTTQLPDFEKLSNPEIV